MKDLNLKEVKDNRKYTLFDTCIFKTDEDYIWEKFEAYESEDKSVVVIDFGHSVNVFYNGELFFQVGQPNKEETKIFSLGEFIIIQHKNSLSILAGIETYEVRAPISLKNSFELEGEKLVVSLKDSQKEFFEMGRKDF